MSVGRWMTLDVAFRKAVAIEGVPGEAFPKFSKFLLNGEIECRASRNAASFYGLDDDEKFCGFPCTERFWGHMHLKLDGDRIRVEPCHDLDYFDEEDKGFVTEGGELFVVEEWTLSVSVESFDRALSPSPAPKRLAKVIESRKGVGGRPTIYDWAGAAAVAAASVGEDDYPPDQIALIEILTSWFAEHHQRSPERREIEKFVSKMYAEGSRLKAVREARREARWKN